MNNFLSWILNAERFIEYMFFNCMLHPIILINGVYASVILFNILARLYNCRCVALNAHIRLEKQDNAVCTFAKFTMYMHIIYTYLYDCLLWCKILCT